ncbi:Uncharacterised protein [Mycobacteroides abscessus subsp. bolletii]|jgi:hypothetical protein|nr:Uncharacterised protein [Mycobacteroides abscessus subsp. bolletii]SHR31070.1 Uncharacterised protein [Mycobacteroides abscessus subsp. abscessus]BBZ84277.1 hypothetical protein MABM_41930 [Mycobacteroides abscessus]SHR55851.1 Uncharacterised protein [Mycobacteroides abscessus subsp. bolletii]SHS01498.1 Uncharacterised protein [Mycobacteroides abscessus subsp. bolletii]
MDESERAEQLSRDRVALTWIGPKLRRLAQDVGAEIAATQREVAAPISAAPNNSQEYASPGLEAVDRLSTEVLPAITRALAERISATAGIAELGSLAETHGQIDALRARVRSWRPLGRENPVNSENDTR